MFLVLDTRRRVTGRHQCARILSVLVDNRHVFDQPGNLNLIVLSHHIKKRDLNQALMGL